MAEIIFRKPESNLKLRDRAEIIESIRRALTGRVSAAYLFGSFAAETTRADSDIDIIIIKETLTNFVERPLEFDKELRKIFPDIDILVYTAAEFERMKEQKSGFLAAGKGLLQII